jgi:hypothetical protein
MPRELVRVGYAILVSAAIRPLGTFHTAGQIPELATAPCEVGYHLAAETLAALALLTAGAGLFITEYGHRWEAESGYRSIKRFMAATTSTDFGFRFFYFVCLLYSVWRAVDLLVQVELTGEYEHSPLVTADNTLTLLKKETGIG